VREVRVARLGLDRATNSPVVVLQAQEDDRVLPIWIGVAEASAIALELQGVKPPRPLTHDLLKQLLTGLGGTLRRVVIADVRDNTYFAELIVTRDDALFAVDARPSDAIALALRLHAPILAADHLLQDPDEPRTDAPPPDGGGLSPDELKQYLEGLDPQDFGRFQP
jgi:bifunctional DNase/RNase